MNGDGLHLLHEFMIVPITPRGGGGGVFCFLILICPLFILLLFSSSSSSPTLKQPEKLRIRRGLGAAWVGFLLSN